MLVPSPAIFDRSNSVARTPSNWTTPARVASHRYPSRVCSIEVTVLWGSPESMFQESRTHCDNLISGEACRETAKMRHNVGFLIKLSSLDVG